MTERAAIILKSRESSIFFDENQYNILLDHLATFGHGNTAECPVWPACEVPGCEAKCCIKLRSRRCHPHTVQWLGTYPASTWFIQVPETLLHS